MSAFYLNDLGVACPLGNSLPDVTRHLFAAVSGVARSERFSPGRMIPVGAVEVPLPSLTFVPLGMRSQNNRLALAAARQIAPSVKRAVSRYGAHRVAVSVGTSTSGVGESESAIRSMVETGEFPPEFHAAQREMASPAAFVAHLFGITGPAVVHSTACASSAKALSSAARLLQLGVVDAVVTGGVDTLCGFTIAGFGALELLSTQRCNPLSANRDGINLGEAAVFFLMTREPATVSLRGWGESTDAYHFSAPDPTGRGARLAVERALERGGVRAAVVEYVNLHGTGTLANDAMEAAVVHALFGGAVAVSSTKPLTGHTLGAAGAIEAAFCWIAMQDANVTGALPPHLWDGAPDPSLPPLRVALPGHSLGHPPRWALSNSFAFGGANASLLFARE